jgi:hypothetical protein
VKCPIAVTAGAVKWAFSATLPSFYIHGRGSFSSGHAKGSLCEQSSSRARASTQLVLGAGPRGSLARGITRAGVLGAELVLALTVTQRNAPGCPKATRGSLTLFSSYNGVHRDSVKLHLGGGCAGFSHSFSGAGVRVSLPR